VSHWQRVVEVLGRVKQQQYVPACCHLTPFCEPEQQPTGTPPNAVEGQTTGEYLQPGEASHIVRLGDAIACTLAGQLQKYTHLMLARVKAGATARRTMRQCAFCTTTAIHTASASCLKQFPVMQAVCCRLGCCPWQHGVWYSI
jgi:hypothetical protein